MLDTPPQPPARLKLKLEILLPMTFGLLLFLGLYIASTSWYLDQEIERNLKQKIVDIETSFQSLLDQRAQIMKVQLEQLAESEQLKNYMTARDRAGLLAAATPDFKRFL